ncbi:hypothetical protein [Ralstonia pseudosolanacearum]|uniref:Uncharacterized protein n=1 Tax=Ralstonia solanacearum TaxID=305 RepID=A0A0S4WF19_RALSL|nr:hypothetical protein [Ralstonia pseudosolanacearum]CUV45269.1 protein of unknown function [Ralstonia solanacearum]MDO3508574.1 hypothetical protein [Ralstonia pseudosolanacearum]MDO3513906.1 hypothetical protein [Ralstonia pseudosolanacearum]MDO3523010.1 hypothetical protein [Ralstonia pseudosolanacearum]MDO3537999.1 hypothetical protein [Ralstonia pseudosolanacearum]
MTGHLIEDRRYDQALKHICETQGRSALRKMSRSFGLGAVTRIGAMSVAHRSHAGEDVTGISLED